jgi:hypothetical protein
LIYQTALENPARHAPKQSFDGSSGQLIFACLVNLALPFCDNFA